MYMSICYLINFIFILEMFYTSNAPNDVSVINEQLKKSSKEQGKNIYTQVRKKINEDKLRTVWGAYSDQMFTKDVLETLKKISFEEAKNRIYVGYVIIKKVEPSLYSTHMIPFMFNQIKTELAKEKQLDKASLDPHIFCPFDGKDSSVGFEFKTYVSVCEDQTQLETAISLIEKTSFTENLKHSDDEFAEMLIVFDEPYNYLDIQIFKKILRGAKHGILVILPTKNYDEEKERIALNSLTNLSNTTCFFKCNLDDNEFLDLESPFSLFVDETRISQEKEDYEKKILCKIRRNIEIGLLEG